MREILFKAKRLENREWVEGSLISFADGGRAILPSKSAALCKKGASLFFTVNCLEVDPSTVCQYTGLTDRNGAKVFENDKMIFYAYGKNYCGFVEFINGSFGVNCKVAEPFLDDAISKHKAIVIGNIHDGEGGQHEERQK